MPKKYHCRDKIVYSRDDEGRETIIAACLTNEEAQFIVAACNEHNKITETQSIIDKEFYNEPLSND